MISVWTTSDELVLRLIDYYGDNINPDNYVIRGKWRGLRYFHLKDVLNLFNENEIRELILSERTHETEVIDRDGNYVAIIYKQDGSLATLTSKRDIDEYLEARRQNDNNKN